MTEHHCLSRALPARLRDLVSHVSAHPALQPVHLQPPLEALPTPPARLEPMLRPGLAQSFSRAHVLQNPLSNILAA